MRSALIAIGILALCAAWRLILMQQMPCISRDGVLYCEFARELGERGTAAMRDPRFAQHPLFPIAILGVQRALHFCGVSDDPLTWQAAGRCVSFSAGLGLVIATGWLTIRLARAQGVTDGGPGLWAILFCGLLPLNMWLSIDVMSEPLFLLFCMIALGWMISDPAGGNAARMARALGIGLLAGFAFLVRPEGATIAVAGAAAILAASAPLIARVRACFALALGFVVLAGPYMSLVGGISPKLDKQTLDEFQADAIPQMRVLADLQTAPLNTRLPVWAALIRHDRPWYLIVPWVIYETLRGGRVVIPLLALAEVWPWRRRWLGSPLLPLALTAMLHFTLCALLAARHGYLDPRHTLLIAMVCIPTAAILLARITAWSAIDDGMRPSRRVCATGLILLVLGPLAVYSARIPNAADRPLREIADWVTANVPNRGGRLLIGGASERRISFYSGMRWQGWPENEPSIDARFEKLKTHILTYPTNYFALRAGPGAELAGNQKLLERLQSDAQLKDRLRLLREALGPDGTHAYLFAFESRQ